MMTTETEEVVRQQRVNEHKTILDMIALLNKRLSKVEDAVPVTLLVTLENLETRLSKIENDDKSFIHAIGDKALLSKLKKDVEDNRKNLYFVEDELRNHCKEETTNDKRQG